LESLLDIWREMGQAVIGLVTLPYFYIAIALVWWYTRRGVSLQRKLFHVRMYGTITLTLTRLLGGIAIGAALSLVSFGAGADLTSETLIFLWITMGVLALFRLRYICMAYAAGMIGVLQAVSDWTGLEASAQGILADTAESLAAIDTPGLLFMAGMLHIGEGLLVRLQGSKLSIPLFLQGKRGKPMGGYALAGVWPIPLIWLIPASSGGFTLPWTPLFGMGGETAGWSLLAFPVLISFTDRTVSFWPEEKSRISGSLLILSGAIVAALAVGAHYWSPLVIAASLAAFLLHEGLLFISRWRERGRDPRYSQEWMGVKVLAVLPYTPAADLGLQAGEVIKKVNGAAVRSKEQLHAALERQSAFCKLEVVNREGHIKFLQRARYEGEHYQLGIILAPDEGTEFVAGPRAGSLWHGWREAGAQRRKASPTMLARRETELAEAEQAAAAVQLALEAAQIEEIIEDPGLPPRLSKKNEV
jgi:hypothetical protein